jgi:hypothetical protein
MKALQEEVTQDLKNHRGGRWFEKVHSLLTGPMDIGRRYFGPPAQPNIEGRKFEWPRDSTVYEHPKPFPCPLSGVR